MPPTLRDIANHLGVSPQAVSLALNKPPGAGRISPELRERVVATALEMGYQPNRLARALVRGQSQSLGLLMVAPGTLPWVEALRGVSEEAATVGYTVLLHAAQGVIAPEEQLTAFAESRVDGLVSVAQSATELSEAVLARKPQGVPLISINLEVEAEGVVSIVMDNRAATLQATRHLMRLGHTRIAYLDVPKSHKGTCPPLQSSSERRDGYLEAMRDAALEPSVVSLDMVPVDDRVNQACAAALDLLKQSWPPTAFCCAADWEGIGVIRACASLGLRVPEDVAVFGFDDREAGRWVVPALSTVRPAFDEAGRLAVRRLLGWGEEPRGETVTRLPCELVFRASAPALPGA